MSLVSVASLREIKAHRGDKDDTRLLLVGLPGGGLLFIYLFIC